MKNTHTFATPSVLLQVCTLPCIYPPFKALVFAKTCKTKPTIHINPDPKQSGALSDVDHTQVHLIYRRRQSIHQSNDTTKYHSASLASYALTRLPPPVVIVLASETISSAQLTAFLSPFHTLTFFPPLVEQTAVDKTRTHGYDSIPGYLPDQYRGVTTPLILPSVHPPQTTAKHQSASLTLQ